MGLYNRDKHGREKSLMSKYEEVRAFYSHAGISKNHGYKNTDPFYVSIFSYIDDGNEEKATKTKGLSARQYYIYNQGLSLNDVNIPKDKRRKVKSASEFKGLLDTEVSKYIKKVAGKYADMSDGQIYKIVEQRVQQNLKELGVLDVDTDEEFNKKFLEALFQNSKKLSENKAKDLVKKTFLDIQDFLNKSLSEGSASLSTRKGKVSKKDIFVIKFDKDMEQLELQYKQLFIVLRRALKAGLKEGALTAKTKTQLETLMNSIKNKTLIYEKKVGTKQPTKAYQTYFNKNGTKMAMKSLVRDDGKISIVDEVTSVLNQVAGLGYEVGILATAIELMRQGRDEIGNFKEIPYEELKRRALQEMLKSGKKSKDIKIEGKTFSGAVTGDLVVKGRQSKADVVLTIKNELKKTQTEFKISAKNYKGKNYNIHNGKVTSFANAISQKGRHKEAYIAQSMFDTISWYPSYFGKNKENNSVFETFRKMILLNLDFFYGFDVTQLFSSGSDSYQNISDAIVRTAIKNIRIKGDSINLFIRVNKDVQ